jgi:hypothetical protein
MSDNAKVPLSTQTAEYRGRGHRTTMTMQAGDKELWATWNNF